jgi:hypothetical protein
LKEAIIFEEDHIFDEADFLDHLLEVWLTFDILRGNFIQYFDVALL